MKYNLTKKEVEEIIKENYRQSCYIELGKVIEKVEINEYSEDADKFCVITLTEEKKEIKK